MENISSQYPDAVELVKDKVMAKEAILEAECVAMDLETDEMRPFQELMHRRRKYGVKAAMEQYPVSLFMFDALYVDGKDLTLDVYPLRRKALEDTVKRDDRAKVAHHVIAHSPKQLEEFFEEASKTVAKD